MHPVIDLILKRKKENSKPGKRSDSFKLGLAIEGGGMRGLVTSGMGTAIEHLGLTDCFDIILGTSAGAFNGAYLLAEQANYGGTIYYQDINNDHFINLKRFFKAGQSIMSLNYLVYHVAKYVKVLDCNKIIESKIPLVIMVSSINELKAIQLRDFKTPEQIYSALNATACMPIIAGPPVKIGNQEYFDGGVFESIPYHSALQERCTHILVFLSRKQGLEMQEPNFFEDFFYKKILKKYPGINDALIRRRKTYPEDIRFLEQKTIKPSDPPYIYAIQPSSKYEGVSRLEKNREKLLNGAKSGFEAVYSTFRGNDIRVFEMLEVFTPDGKKLNG